MAKTPFQVNGKRGDVKHNVRILLTDYPYLRDDKLRCCTFYWYFVDAPKLGKDLKVLTSFEWMQLYLEGKFENQASIERQWQKVQEEDKRLRGDSWEARQAHTRNVINDLKKG